MSKEIISNKQAVSLLVLFVTGSSLVLGRAGSAKSDIWLAIILAVIMGITVVVFYARILILFPGENLFGIVQKIFGKFLGDIICLFYIWYSFFLTTLIINDYGEFIGIIGLDSTPKIVLMIVFMFLVVWGVKNGIEVLGRCSELFLIILFIFILFSLPLMLPQIESNNLKPVLSNGWKPVFKAAYYTFEFPFAETVIFLSIFDSLQNSKKSYKVYISGLLISGLILFVLDVVSFLVLGKYAYGNEWFPIYAAASRINIKDVLQRIEISIAISFFLAGYIEMCICTLATCKGICKIFDFKDYRFLVTPISILTLIGAITNFNGIIEEMEWSKTYYYYAVLFQIILPIIILIGAEIKIRIQKNKY